MRLSPSTRRTLATIAAFLMLLAGMLLAVSTVGDDSSSAPNPKPSPSVPASTVAPSPSTTPNTGPTSTPLPTPTMPPDPTDGSCNIFDPECDSGGTGGSVGVSGGADA